MQTCVMLSIKPEFAEKIFSGEKKFEFRRTMFKSSNVKKIVLYVSSPVQKVVGEFDVDMILSLDTKTLWIKTKRYSGIEREYFDKYFTGKTIGNAIGIKNVIKYSEPMDLNYFNVSHAPQSFIYLEEGT